MVKDKLLDVPSAIKALGIAQRTLFLWVKQRKIPFIRTGFSLKNPRGNLYFSQLRLKDTTWGHEHNIERDAVEREEKQERALAYRIASLSLEIDESLIKSQNGKIPREKREEAAVDMIIKKRELDPLLDEIREFRRQRLINFFGKDAAIVFFRDGFFKGEFEKMKRSYQHDFYTAQPLNEDAVEAARMAEENQERALRRAFAEQQRKKG